MDMSFYRKIIEQAWDLTNTINFSYFGEPTLHPDFIECMSLLKNRPSNTKVHIFSNFLPMTLKHLDAIVGANVSHLNISLDASNSAQYEKIRGGNYCLDLDGKVWTGNRMEKVEEKIKYWFARPDHIPTRHEFTTSHYNSNDADKFVGKWKPFLSSKDTIVTKAVLSYGGVMLDEPLLTNFHCNMWDGSIYLVVTWDGKVGPCFLDIDMGLQLGNAKEASLKSILESKTYQEVKTLSKSKNIVPCKTCRDANNHSNDKVYSK
jgi:radical SAM protein with 4Fe4S-binding SPASM domain